MRRPFVHWGLILLVATFWGKENSVQAWHDEGHMLVVAVAKEYLKPETVQKIEFILSEWSPQYPTTSTLETAAVWLDHVACSMPGRYCRGFLGLDDIRIFKPWHYTSHVFNPQNITLDPVYAVQPYPQTGSSWILQKSYESLKNCSGGSRARADVSGFVAADDTKKENDVSDSGEVKTNVTHAGLSPDFLPASLSFSFFPFLRLAGERLSALLPWKRIAVDSRLLSPVDKDSSSKLSLSPKKTEKGDALHPKETNRESEREASVICSRLSLNLHLRLLLHIYGDSHQPLHATETYSRAFPKGDFGGNNIPLVLPKSEKKREQELATYEYPDLDENDKLGDALPRQVTLHSVWDGAFGQYNSLFYQVDLDALKKEAQRLVRLYPADNHARRTFSDFHGISYESFLLARSHVFSEFDWSTFSPSSLPYHPSPEYIEKSKKVCEKQIALAGARLALLLESLSDSLPPPPPVFDRHYFHHSFPSPIVGGEGKVEVRSACSASEGSFCLSVQKGLAPVVLLSGPTVGLDSAAMALIYSRPLAVLFLFTLVSLLILGILLFWTCRQLRFYKHAVSLATATTAMPSGTDTESGNVRSSARPGLNFFSFLGGPLCSHSAVVPHRPGVNLDAAMAARLLENRETVQSG